MKGQEHESGVPTEQKYELQADSKQRSALAIYRRGSPQGIFANVFEKNAKFQ